MKGKEKIMSHLTQEVRDKSSAIADMAAQCRTSRIKNGRGSLLRTSSRYNLFQYRHKWHIVKNGILWATYLSQRVLNLASTA